MKYFAIYNDDGTLQVFGGTEAKTNVINEITETEYNNLMREHETLIAYVDAVILNEIVLEEVPEIYRMRVQEIVLEIQECENLPDPNVEEALTILRGEVEE